MADVASQIAAASQGSAQMRVGRVVVYDSLQITVDVGGGSLLAMPYLRSYRPMIGDLVTCMNQGATWMCLGVAAGIPPDNAVANPSFEDSAAGSMASGWGTYHDPTSTANTSTISVWFIEDTRIDGSQALAVQASTTSGSGTVESTDFVYSSPIGVNPGETWIGAAHARLQAGFAYKSHLASVAVGLAWHANSTDVYPTTVAVSSIAQSYLSNSAEWSLIGAAADETGILVPDGASFVRLLLASQLTFDASIQAGPLYWDLAIARKVS